MRPGVIVWVLGSPEKIEERGRMVKAAIKDCFGFSDIIREDEVREQLCENEGEGADIRRLAAERTGWLCHLLERNGGAGIALSHASKRAERDEWRKKASSMIEVLVSGDLPGELEPPYYPEVELAEGDGPDEVAAKTAEALKALGLVEESSSEYDKDEEELVKDRLEKLGYL